MLLAAPAASSAAVVATFPIAARREHAYSGFTGFSADRAAAILRACATVLVIATCTVPAPGDIDTNPGLAHEMLVAGSAAAPAIVVPAVSACTGCELARSLDTLLPAGCAAAVTHTGRTILTIHRIAQTVATALPAVHSAHVAILVRIADSVSTPRNVHTDPGLALVVRLATPTASAATVVAALKAITGDRCALPKNTGLTADITTPTASAAAVVPAVHTLAASEYTVTTRTQLAASGTPAVCRTTVAGLSDSAQTVPADQRAFLVDTALVQLGAVHAGSALHSTIGVPRTDTTGNGRTTTLTGTAVRRTGAGRLPGS